MSTIIQFYNDSVILKLTGLTGLFALKFKLKMPHNTIKGVYVDYFDAPQWMLRMPGTSIRALNIYEGSFKYANEWYFLSYERRVPLLIIELKGHEKYRYAIFDIDDPTSVAAEIRKSTILVTEKRELCYRLTKGCRKIMITHFAELHLSTVSVQGVKQFYYDQLRIPISYETHNEIRFQVTEHFTLSFKEVAEFLAPTHIAFEVPNSEFKNVVNWLKRIGISFFKMVRCRVIDDFETGNNVYFRDGDGNLLEIITHKYLEEGILTPSGDLKILFYERSVFQWIV